MSARRFRILMADDSDDDRYLISRVLRRTEELALIDEVDNGEQVVSYLRGDPAYADRARHPFPDLLLLDLRMPRLDGFEVLQWINETGCRPATIVVFSSSPIPQDVRRAMEMGADLYQLKPRHLEDFPVVAEKLRFLLHRERQNAEGSCRVGGSVRHCL